MVVRHFGTVEHALFNHQIGSRPLFEGGKPFSAYFFIFSSYFFIRFAHFPNISLYFFTFSRSREYFKFFSSPTAIHRGESLKFLQVSPLKGGSLEFFQVLCTTYKCIVEEPGIFPSPTGAYVEGEAGIFQVKQPIYRREFEISPCLTARTFSRI